MFSWIHWLIAWTRASRARPLPNFSHAKLMSLSESQYRLGSV
jgi:hypothetical protein